ncbi:hypothetical protein OG937_24450 [Streptomyces sp. NBC_00510]
MRNTVPNPVNPSALTVDDITRREISDLLNTAHAEIIESDELAREDKFLGSIYQRNDGAVFLVMPSGQEAGVRDHMARGLIAALFDVKVPGWPGKGSTAYRARAKSPVVDDIPGIPVPPADPEAGAA